MLDGTDADGEWSDEEAVRSGSNTGVSETEQDDHQTVTIKRPQPGVKVSPMSTYRLLASTNPLSSADPVNSILDKIDAEIEAMDKDYPISSMKVTSSKSSRPGSNGKTKSSHSRQHRSSIQVPSLNLNKSAEQDDTDTGLGSTSLRGDDGSTLERINGTVEVYSEAALTDGQTDEDTITKNVEDVPSDLDSLVAQQIDLKFKEIMRKKKVPPDLPVHPGKPSASGSLSSRLRQRNTSRQSAVMLSTGYGTDNDSVKTEDFEAKFMNMIVMTSDTEQKADAGTIHEKQPVQGNEIAQDRGNVPKNTPAITSSLPMPSSKETPVKLSGTEDDNIIQRLRNIADGTQTNKANTVSLPRPRSLSPTRLRNEKKVSIMDTALANQDAREIERESLRIQREMERERRARSASPAPGARPSTGLYHSTNIPGKQDAHTKKSKSPQTDLSNDITQMFANTSAQFSKAEDELIAGHELKTLRQALLLTRKELREAEGELKNVQELSDDARSGLMVVEFKRGNLSKDLERIVDDIKRKKNQLSALDSEYSVKVNEVKNIHALGLTKEDCMEVKNVKDDNVCLKTKVRNLEGIQLERDELLRQLDAAKEDVLREQKHGRLQRAELQAELENLMAKLEETQNGWGDGQIQLAKLEAAFRKMEKEKNHLIQEKLMECNELKSKLKTDSEDTRSKLKEEMNGLDVEINELRTRVADVQSENESKETIIEKLRAQISEQQSVMAKERQDRHKTASEQKKALQKLKKETSSAVLKLKESMFLDRQKAMEELTLELEQERREKGARSEDRMSQMLKEHSEEIQEKNEEIVKLQEMMRRMENDKVIEMEQQIREAVSRERDRVEKDKDWQIRKQKEEGNKKTTEFLAQVEREKKTNKELHKEMTDLRKELEEQRRQQREASKEKLVAIARAKDQVKEQSSAELERIRFNLKEEHQRELDLLREKLRSHENDLVNLQSDKESVTLREREAWQALEHAERTVISEINEECHKVSKILGISPRTVHHTSFRLENADGRISPSIKSRSTLNAALANLRAGNEELHNHIAELQQEVESLRTMVETVTKEKEEAIENCRLQMEKQKTLDLEKLKEKLLKEHIQEMSDVIRDCAESNSQLKTNNHHLQRYGDAALLEALQAKEDDLRSMQTTMSQWQAETEGKYSTRLQLQMAKEREKYQALQHHSTREQKRISDLQKREIERLEREVKRLSAMSQNNSIDSNRYETSDLTTAAREINTSSSSPTSKSSPNYLKARIKQLQADNDLLRKQRLLFKNDIHLSNSNLTDTPDVPPKSPIRPMSPTRDPSVLHRLEERMRLGEQESLKAEERAKLNQKLLNNKMVEMTKLQNTLTSQNQELQDLEKAYSELHKHYKKTRPTSPNRFLNTTI